MDSNDEIKQKLESLKNGDSIVQNHSGTGDNFVGGKTINNISYIMDKEGLNNKFELSNEAEELLKEAINDQKRRIIQTDSISEGIQIQANGKCFTENVDIRTANKYINALVELIEIRFVKPRGDIFNDVTERGYKYIDNISK